MSHEPLLTLEGVHTHIGQYHILQGVDLAVPRGALHGAARPQRRRQDHDAAHHHGAVARLARAASRFDGRDIAGTRTPDIARAGIAYVPENMGMFSDLTVHENLRARRAPRPARRARGSTGFSACSRR